MKFWEHPLVKEIGPDQFSSLFKGTITTIIGKVVAATIVAHSLWGNISGTEILIWWGSTILCAIYIYWRWKKNKSRVVKKISQKAITRTLIVTAMIAMPWLYLVIAHFGNLPGSTELIIVAAFAGMTAAGSIQISNVYPASILYLAMTSIPLIIKCFWLADTDYFLLGLLAIGYTLFLLSVSRQAASLSIDRTKAIRALEQKVDEMARAKNDMHRYAMEDPLTNLPNRREFNNRLKTAINEAKRQDSGVTLLIADLDHFKNINDIAGHNAGDSVLKAVASRLKGAVRDYDIVARIGGDEFAIIAKHHKSPKDTADFTQRLLDAVNKPLTIAGSDVRPGLSVGISMFPYDAQNSETILSHADLALQRGKSTGRGQFYFFDQQMKRKFSSDEIIENDLRLALLDEELEMFYQPKVCIRTGHLQGFEALLRWRRHDGTMVAPGDFFPVAEERGLISYISDFVIERSLQDMKSWLDQGMNPGKLSINIHPTQIKDDHRMKRIVRDIERAGINPSDIFLEITEGCIMGRGTEDVPRLLEFLRNKGIQISLDDFGTGFASLSHLKDLPVDELKFDRSFISDLLKDAPTRAIVHSMVKLAQSLGIKTVAEGVETKEQHNVLLAIGCTTGQGYFYNRPLDYAAATRLIEADAAAQGQRERKIVQLVSPGLATEVKSKSA
jgi:diguanylate cyclase (GGDEF)-like protein